MQTDAFTRKIFYRLDPGRLFSAIDHLFIYLFIYSFIHLFIYLFIYLFNHTVTEKIPSPDCVDSKCVQVIGRSSGNNFGHDVAATIDLELKS